MDNDGEWKLFAYPLIEITNENDLNEKIIKKAISLSQKHSVELMCHPGVNTPHPGIYAEWGMDWDRERQMIIDHLAGVFS